MSNNINTKLLEDGAEIYDGLHKYEQARYDRAMDKDDIDTIYEIVQTHYSNVIEDLAIV